MSEKVHVDPKLKLILSLRTQARDVMVWGFLTSCRAEFAVEGF